MRFSTWIAHRKQTAAFRFASLMPAIVLLCLMLIAANYSVYSQTSDDVSKSNTAAAPSPADWTQFLRDNMQRWNPYETVIGVNNAASLGLKWKNPIGTYVNGIESSPAVVNGVAYFGSDDGNVYALNASAGVKVWSFATGSVNFLDSSPAVANGVVYIGSFDGNMYALNASTGAKLWSYKTGGAVASSPTVVNGVVYFGSGNDNVYALNASTGTKLWSFTPKFGVGYSSPAVANGVVYVCAGDGTLYALNATTGTKLWSYATGGLGDTSPAVANGMVYIGGSNLYALNASTGGHLWTFPIQMDSALAVANGVVYVAGDVPGAFGTVYALNASTGATLWSYETHGAIDSSPAVANGVVYVSSHIQFLNGSQVGDLYALNASTGSKLWSYDIGIRGHSSPTIVNGMVYVRAGTTAGGNIYAFAAGLTSADLFLRIFPSATTVHQGDLLTYAFPVWNLGPNNASLEVLNTQVPAGTTFDYIRISGTRGLGTCTHPPYQETGQIVCHENASMAPNTTWTVRLTVKVTASPGTGISANAATMADTPDPNMANNTATVSIKVQ